MLTDTQRKSNTKRLEVMNLPDIRKDDLIMEVCRMLESDGWPGDLLEIPERLSSALYRRNLRDMSRALPSLRAAWRRR